MKEDKPTQRPYNRIEYSNETRKNNIQVKRGSQQETTSLNINLKTISKNYLLQILGSNESTSKAKIIKDYINDKANFTSTRRLFGSEKQDSEQEKDYRQIRDHMVAVYQDTDFVKKILANEKMDLRTKLLFLKFLERIRLSAIKPQEHKLWKERF